MMNPRPVASLSGALLGTLLLSASSASALPLVDIDVGLKGALGFNLLLAEDKFENPAAKELFGGDDGFGTGGGGGLYAEVRLLDHVGLELDLQVSRDQVKRTESWNNGMLDLEHTSWATNLRVPALLKGYVGAGPLRLSLGVGLEYVHALDHGYDIEEVDRAAGVPANSADAYIAMHHSRAKDSTYLVGQLELAIDLIFLSIPIDLRAGYNLSQTDTFEDRYDYTLTGQQVTRVDVQAIYTWDFRLLTGVAFSF